MPIKIFPDVPRTTEPSIGTSTKTVIVPVPIPGIIVFIPVVPVPYYISLLIDAAEATVVSLTLLTLPGIIFYLPTT